MSQGSFEEAKRLFDSWWVGVNVAASHDLTIYEGPGFWKSMRSVLCMQCRLGALDTCSQACRGLNMT